VTGPIRSRATPCVWLSLRHQNRSTPSTWFFLPDGALLITTFIYPTCHAQHEVRERESRTHATVGFIECTKDMPLSKPPRLLARNTGIVWTARHPADSVLGIGENGDRRTAASARSGERASFELRRASPRASTSGSTGRDGTLRLELFVALRRIEAYDTPLIEAMLGSGNSPRTYRWRGSLRLNWAKPSVNRVIKIAAIGARRVNNFRSRRPRRSVRSVSLQREHECRGDVSVTSLFIATTLQRR